MKRAGIRAICVLAVAVGTSASNAPAAPQGKRIGINVLLNTEVTDAILADLAGYGKVRGVVTQINGVTLQAPESALPAVRALPFVTAANPDAERQGSPVDTVSAENFSAGLSAWDQDAINVTEAPFSSARGVDEDGSGVYVAVLDTGLLDSWRQYFPQERIATQFGKAFSGGGGEVGAVSEPTNQWEHDQNSHGTHVTSTVLGYSFLGTPINGVAPKAKVIPVKVLNQAGFGWSSVIAHGIVYVADLKAGGALGGSPVVINMSLGGPVLDAVEQAAIDYAISRGVIVVASAGNRGAAGMGFPGAYPPVISVAAAGWIGQWLAGDDTSTRNWWIRDDVPEPSAAHDFFIASFSSRELAGQDLDVTGPGVATVGPYQLQSGKTSYFFLSGTSMSSPHVAGIAALMMQKNPTLSQADVEATLEAAAIPMPADCRTVATSSGGTITECWSANATGAGFITADAALAATP